MEAARIMRPMSAMVPRSPAAAARRVRAVDDADPPARRVAYRPPLDWRALLGFLGQRAVAGVEWVEPGSAGAVGAGGGAAYRRVVRLPGRAGGPGRVGWIEVATAPSPRPPPAAPGTPGPRPAASRHALWLRVDPSLAAGMAALLACVRHALDLRCRPAEVAAALGTLAAGHEGVRLPGAFDPYEIGVRAVLGQQITVRQARVLAGRFVAVFGEPVATPWPTLTHAFPTAVAMAARDPADIGALGVTRQRARTLVALAEAIASGAVDLSPSADPATAIARLRALPGIGDWTAQYLAMRALRFGDAFPAADVGVMRALGVSTPRAAAAAAEAFRPWRGYAVIHLWRSLAPSAPQEAPR
jgi:AraC family transcriptional regulator of adaptative response / DNA-3-methyladenine glycosylase II